MSRRRKKSSKKYNYFDIREESIKKLRELCPLNEFRKLQPDELKSLNLLPKALVDKYDSIFLLSSGSNNSEAYYMLNGNRVDYNDNAIDQMPFGVVCSGSNPITNGVLIQHGDWEDRTHNPTEDFWTHISESGIGSCYPLQEMPEEDSGSLNQLKIKSQQDAFSDLVEKLKKNLNM